MVGVVGEIHSGKSFTTFGLKDDNEPASSELRDDMRGVLPRLVDELIDAEDNLNIPTEKVKIYARWGFINR